MPSNTLQLLRRKPNRPVSQPPGNQSKLTYAVQVDPSPLTASLGNGNSTLGSLEVTITNGTNQTLQVNSIKFTIIVGDQADCLTTGTGSFAAATSDNTLWSVSLPGDVSSGTADIILESPQENTPVPLAPSVSVVMQIYQIPTSVVPGTSVVTVKEEIGGSYSNTSFSVTTFPYGFYFNSLTASVPNGGDFVPVSQVGYKTPVTLLWDSSVVTASDVTILFSSNQGQQAAIATLPGEWVSPALTTDTVFTVQVSTKLFNSEPVVATLTVPVSVTPKDVVANSLAVLTGSSLAGTTTISGPLAVTGSVQIVQGATSISVGTYSANTDGLVIGSIAPPPGTPTDNCFGAIHGTCGQVTMTAAGGYVSPAGLPAYFANGASSFVLPVAQNASWTISSGGTYGTPPICQFWFVTIGVGSAQLSQVSGPGPMPEITLPAPNKLRISPELKSIFEALLLDDATERKKRVQSLLDAES